MKVNLYDINIVSYEKSGRVLYLNDDADKLLQVRVNINTRLQGVNCRY